MPKRDPMEMAEQGMGQVEDLIAQGLPQAKRQGQSRNPKAGWKQTNIRIEPTIKRRLKMQAQRLDVPLEDIIHVALSHFLKDLEADEIELQPKPLVTKRTLV